MRFVFWFVFFFVCSASFLHSQNNSYADSLLNRINQEKVDSEKVILLLKLAKYYQSIDDYSNLLANANQALELSKKINFSKGEASANNTMGIVYYRKGDYKNATKYYIAALRAIEKRGDKKNAAALYTNIGLIYLDESFHKQAYEYLNKALSIRISLKDTLSFPGTYGNLGLVLFQEGQLATDKKIKRDFYNASAKNYDESLKWSVFLNDSIALSNAYGNLSNLYRETGEIDKAIAYSIKAVEIGKRLGDRSGEASSYIDLGLCYMETKQLNKAEEAFINAMRISNEIANIDIVRYSYQTLATLYEAKGDFKQANYFFRKYSSVKDSILNSENTRQINEMQAIYETDKKEQENKLLAAENTLKNEEIETQKRTRNYLVIILLISVIVIALAIFAYQKIHSANKLLSEQKTAIVEKNKQLHKQKEEIEKQKELVEEHQKEIIDSINYAQKIQSAILPSLEDFEKSLPYSFVLFKPKDIVSGDFYWITEKEHFVFYVAADCTGHGVPGGFMSMLGTSLLNEVVNEKKIYEPADILDMLRIKIILALKQKGQTGENKDGMDMVLCRLDKEKNELVYAAANNPLWLIRNGECIEYKADKQPVGISGGISEQFSQTSIQLLPNDSVYIFTDGYADQFGGPKGKKFKYRQLQDVLIENADKPVKEQKEILDQKIMEWRGALEQVDDICVIGLRV
jgi:serine phosphatase RsbU (regulator of sigma subunit)/Tfp pilus assembly protein PilF